MSEARKILFLALDAASPALLRQWCADGTLPNLARAMDRGLVADTRSTEGMEVGATWTSFYTGLNPAGHGICWVDRVIPGTYRQQDVGRTDLAKLTPFWDHLSQAGKRVVLIDIPFTPPPRRDLNGIQVVEWGVHDGVYDFHTVPAPLAKSLRRRYGHHPPPGTCDTTRLDAAGYRDLRDKFLRGIELRGAMTRELIADGRWDFAFQNFNEIHCAGHMLWHYHDPTHPNHDAATVARDGDLLRDVYVAVDREIGTLLDLVGPETTVWLASLHGMEHTTGSSLLLPHILERLGVYAPAPGSPRSVKASTAAGRPADPPRRTGRRGLLRTAWHLVPFPLREALYNFRQWINTRWLERGRPIDIDPERSRAFQMGFGMGSTYSGIRLNIEGREVGGIVRRGADADRCIAEITTGLMEMINPDTGRPLVRRVVRTGDIHQGPRLDELPDLLVEWEYDTGRGNTVVGNGNGGVWRGWSERVGTVEHSNGGGRTGAHRLEGMLVVTGPGIAPGTTPRVVNAVDFAPTLMAMLGVPMPACDGTAVTELLGNGSGSGVTR